MLCEGFNCQDIVLESLHQVTSVTIATPCYNFEDYTNLHYIAYIQFVPPTEQFLGPEKSRVLES
jgi:hypothetical protein